MNKHVGVLQLIVAMSLSGSIGVFVTMSGQSPANVVFFRCAIAFLCLLPYCGLRGILRRELFTRRVLFPVCVSGIFIVINWLLLFKAYPLISIGFATTVYHVNPFLVLLGGALFFRQRLSIADLAWTAIAFLGLTVAVALPGTFHSVNANDVAGTALTLAASVLYACTVLISKKIADVPPAFVVMMQTFVGVFIVLPFVDFSSLPITAWQWGYVSVLGVVHTFFLYCLVFSAYRKLSVSGIAILSFIYPLSAIAFDYLVYHHTLTGTQWVGIAMIMAGVLGVKIKWKPRVFWRTAAAKG
ncbi:hypothetical protein ASG35_03940 [Burkholderia sp. Leaf177]|uniref:DMT family transporter n=1 Tax=Burkholderia sp. Leaf177 TaxID=1736287 RepID=UPI0006FAD52A|nr:DMT family transporter [Burkholderia sp. Leaf177]KQR81483.1 hypothetical protein ASG35_03940 [Burkholderia sp. Leaf177]